MGRIDRYSYTRIFKEIYIKLFLNICGFNNKMKFLYSVIVLFLFLYIHMNCFHFQVWDENGPDFYVLIST